MRQVAVRDLVFGSAKCCDGSTCGHATAVLHGSGLANCGCAIFVADAAKGAIQTAADLEPSTPNGFLEGGPFVLGALGVAGGETHLDGAACVCVAWLRSVVVAEVNLDGGHGRPKAVELLHGVMPKRGPGS